MPRTAIPVVQASDVGVASAFAAANIDGGIMPPNAILVVSNGSGGTRTITVETPAGLGVPTGLNLSDRTFTVNNGVQGIIGPFNPQFYARNTTPDQGQVWVNIDSATGVNWFAIQIPMRTQL